MEGAPGNQRIQLSQETADAIAPEHRLKVGKSIVRRYNSEIWSEIVDHTKSITPTPQEIKEKKRRLPHNTGDPAWIAGIVVDLDAPEKNRSKDTFERFRADQEIDAARRDGYDGIYAQYPFLIRDPDFQEILKTCVVCKKRGLPVLDRYYWAVMGKVVLVKLKAAIDSIAEDEDEDDEEELVALCRLCDGKRSFELFLGSLFCLNTTIFASAFFCAKKEKDNLQPDHAPPEEYDVPPSPEVQYVTAASLPPGARQQLPAIVADGSGAVAIPGTGAAMDLARLPPTVANFHLHYDNHLHQAPSTGVEQTLREISAGVSRVERQGEAHQRGLVDLNRTMTEARPQRPADVERQYAEGAADVSSMRALDGATVENRAPSRRQQVPPPPRRQRVPLPARRQVHSRSNSLRSSDGALTGHMAPAATPARQPGPRRQNGVMRRVPPVVSTPGTALVGSPVTVTSPETLPHEVPETPFVEKKAPVWRARSHKDESLSPTATSTAAAEAPSADGDDASFATARGSIVEDEEEERDLGDDKVEDGKEAPFWIEDDEIAEQDTVARRRLESELRRASKSSSPEEEKAEITVDDSDMLDAKRFGPGYSPEPMRGDSDEEVEDVDEDVPGFTSTEETEEVVDEVEQEGLDEEDDNNEEDDDDNSDSVPEVTATEETLDETEQEDVAKPKTKSFGGAVHSAGAALAGLVTAPVTGPIYYLRKSFGAVKRSAGGGNENEELLSSSNDDVVGAATTKENNAFCEMENEGTEEEKEDNNEVGETEVEKEDSVTGKAELDASTDEPSGTKKPPAKSEVVAPTKAMDNSNVGDVALDEKESSVTEKAECKSTDDKGAPEEDYDEAHTEKEKTAIKSGIDDTPLVVEEEKDDDVAKNMDEKKDVNVEDNWETDEDVLPTAEDATAEPPAEEKEDNAPPTAEKEEYASIAAVTAPVLDEPSAKEKPVAKKPTQKKKSKSGKGGDTKEPIGSDAPPTAEKEDEDDNSPPAKEKEDEDDNSPPAKEKEDEANEAASKVADIISAEAVGAATPVSKPKKNKKKTSIGEKLSGAVAAISDAVSPAVRKKLRKEREIEKYRTKNRGKYLYWNPGKEHIFDEAFQMVVERMGDKDNIRESARVLPDIIAQMEKAEAAAAAETEVPTVPPDATPMETEEDAPMGDEAPYAAPAEPDDAPPNAETEDDKEWVPQGMVELPDNNQLPEDWKDKDMDSTKQRIGPRAVV